SVSEVVRPPGLDTTRSAARSHSSISVVKPSTRAACRSGTRTRRSSAFTFSLRPAPTTTCKGSGTSSSARYSFSTGPTPPPPAAEPARQLQYHRSPFVQPVLGPQLPAVLGGAEGGVDRDAGDADVAGGDAPVLQVEGALLGGGEVVLAGLVHPQPVRLEVGRHRHLRDLHPAGPAQRREDLG